ncbi:MAG: hypothetical protein JWM61_1617 [Micrococcaceae bacterium]|nr:hypothetical protein [Micrococcaceae bacterium]
MRESRFDGLDGGDVVAVLSHRNRSLSSQNCSVWPFEVSTSFLVALPTEYEACSRGTQNQGNRNFRLLSKREKEDFRLFSE